jgi:hypothetical protein
MSLTAIKNKVTSKVGRQVLITKKHSPVLLFGVGTVGVVATVVLACKATLKMDEVLEEAKKNSLQIADAEALETEEYTNEDARKDSVNNRIQTAVKIGKLYAPAFAIGIVSIGALTGSHIILSRRNVALTAAYAGLDRAFKEYRGRVVDELGHDKDEEFRYGTIEREIAVDTDQGVAVKTVKTVNKDGNKKDPYSFLFDRDTSENWEAKSSYNLIFLQAQQNFCNDILRGKGHLFLNEVLDMLGITRTPAGAVTGWLKGSDGDGYVDFGILNGNTNESRRFLNGDEKSVWLEFNVDGVIYDKI